MGRKKIFLSHCTDDRGIMDAVTESVPYLFQNYDVFCTYEKGIDVGKDRAEEIRAGLLDSDIMIAFVTDSYLRSVICLSEIASFWLQDKPFFPIVYNGSAGRQFLEKLTGEDRIYFDANGTDPAGIIRELQGLLPDITNPERAISWIMTGQSDPDHPAEGKEPRPYIGSEKVYEDVLRYCLRSGVVRMQDTPLPSEVFRRKLYQEHPEEIWLVGTTNAGMIRSFSETFADALASGTDIYCMIADRDSSFLKDVGAIEVFPSECRNGKKEWQKKAKQENERLKGEFDGVKDQLTQIRRTASYRARQAGKIPGRLFFGCTFTLLRQTVTVAISEKRNSLWAWMSVTIPPKKAADGTLGIEVSSEARDGNDKVRSLAESLRSYVVEIGEVARLRGCMIEVTEATKFPNRFTRETELNLLSEVRKQWGSFYGKAAEQIGHLKQNDEKKNEPSASDETDAVAEARKQWEVWYDRAQKRTERRHRKDSEVDLIEIAAQHPLKDGERPDTAFRERLDYAVELYEKLKKAGRRAVLYVPGSIHLPDAVSLSSAGIRYLKETGRVAPEDILPEHINEEYKGEEGVYNSADECFVAAEIYKDGTYTDLYCICSANQMLRKKLFYFRFGVIPKIWAVPDDSFHNDIGEIFKSIPDVLFHDADWQSRDSEQYKRTRKERMPGWKE